MRKSPMLVLAASIVGLVLTSNVYAADEEKKEKKEPTGQELAHNNRKGNCLACHMIPGDPKAISSANIGPPLVAMKARFPDKAKLRKQIADPYSANVMSLMPPFGTYKILTNKEIDLITDYIYGL